jgi:hypothetical protein
MRRASPNFPPGALRRRSGADAFARHGEGENGRRTLAWPPSGRNQSDTQMVVTVSRGCGAPAAPTKAAECLRPGPHKLLPCWRRRPARQPPDPTAIRRSALGTAIFMRRAGRAASTMSSVGSAAAATQHGFATPPQHQFDHNPWLSPSRDDALLLAGAPATWAPGKQPERSCRWHRR